MVLKKPYAFFIKFFKPIHIIVAFLIGWLIYLDGSILSFLRNYISTYSGLSNSVSTIGLSSPLLVAIPIIVGIMCLLILGVMVRKRKPILFYIINIALYIAIVVVNVYALNFLKIIADSAVSIRITKLIHDFVFLAIVAEGSTFILFIARGLGLNIKKFDFDSDLLSMDISESDREEFEVSLNLNIDESRRKRKKFFRLLKYRYYENKVLVNSIVGGFLGFVVVVIIFVISTSINRNVQGKTYNINGLNVTVRDAYILNTDYSGRKITDNYLVVVKVNLSSFIIDKAYLKDFSLRIGNVLLKPTLSYNKYLTDIGVSSSEFDVSSDSGSYILVYEIPEKIINKKLIFRYVHLGDELEVKLKTNSKFNETNKVVNIGEEAVLESSLGNIKFRIDDYDLQEKYSFEYSYCIKNDDCVPSLEYLKPSINESFDKVVLRLIINYSNESDILVPSFYDFFSKFGSIYYNIDGEWKVQSTRFEKLSPLKIASNDVYIGINSEVLKADSLKLVFNVRGSKCEYLLK